jgi:hypothetical protein
MIENHCHLQSPVILMIVGCVPQDFSFHGPGTRYLLAPEFLPQVGNVRYMRMAFPSTTVATVMGGGHPLCLCGN